MKVAPVLILCLFLLLTAQSQTKTSLELQARLKFDALPGDRIIADQLMPGETALLLVSSKTIQRLDLTNGRFTDSHELNTPDSREDNQRLLGPNGRRIVIFGNYSSRDKADKVKHPASIWDLESGNMVAPLNHGKKPVLAGAWSKDGSVLATSTDVYAPRAWNDNSVEVAFWDGETGAYQSSLPSNKVSWWRLTDDGAKCVFTIGRGRNLLWVVKDIVDNGAEFNVWNIKAGKLESTGQQDRVPAGAYYRMLSPDGKLEILESRNQDAGNTHTIAVMHAVPNLPPAPDRRPKYELSLPARKWGYSVSLSPDSKFFAINVNDDLRIYDADTGAMKAEWPKIRSLPAAWLNDDRVLLFDYETRMVGIDTATGKQLYEQPTAYAVSTATDSNGQDFETVEDHTVILVNPTRNLLLTYSNQYVRVYDSITGQLVKELIAPPTEYKNGKQRLSRDQLVSKAAWMNNGNGLYIIRANGKSVELWRIV